MDDSDRSWLSRILTHVTWTPLETIFNNFNKKCETADQVTLKESLEERFRESTLGSFLYHLNFMQRQELLVQEDKLELVLYDLVQKTEEDLTDFQRKNDICENIIDLIQNCLLGNYKGTMHYSDVLSRLPVLRLASSKITTMDESLANLTALKCLILSGNHINDFPGKFLPRTLNYLELFCNCLSDITQLLTEPPERLLYIGLCRNNISREYLGQLSELLNLHYLDLEDNNIEGLIETTDVLQQLKALTSLILQGNPCSMCIGYKSALVSSLPDLMFLDRIHLTEANKLKHTLHYEMSGALQIFGIRIIGIPKPAAEKFNKKKVKHTFHLEVECPLLDAKLKAWDPNEVITVEDDINIDKNDKTKKQSKGKSKTKGDSKKSGKKSDKEAVKGKGNKRSDLKSPKKGKKNVKEEVDETEILFNQMIDEDKLISGACDFQSDRKEWANVLEFPEPAIEIPVEVKDLDLLRNVFRTLLTIRLIHMKTIPPDKKNVKSKNKEKKKGLKANITNDVELIVQSLIKVTFWSSKGF